jgi:hypothetical protein
VVVGIIISGCVFAKASFREDNDNIVDRYITEHGYIKWIIRKSSTISKPKPKADEIWIVKSVYSWGQAVVRVDRLIMISESSENPLYIVTVLASETYSSSGEYSQFTGSHWHYRATDFIKRIKRANEYEIQYNYCEVN